MEYSEEKILSIPDCHLDRTSGRKWETMDLFLPMWKKIFLISCVFAILMDPLFFYIPILKEDIRCFDLDKKLKTTVIVSRSITDISFVIDIIFEVYTTVQAKRSRASKPSAIVRIKRSLRLYIVLIDILVILPFPQVFGAFWYFLSIQREIDCWQYACRSESGCESNTFECDEHMLKNITALNDLCSKNPQNALLFDFGIYHDAFQSGMLGSTDVPRKLLHCIWWGLRNLSSLGQNLQTSSSAGENIFALTIFLFGMLLFVVYVSDILEIRQQWQAEKLKKFEIINQEIRAWLSTNGIPKNMHSLILKAFDRKFGNKEDVDAGNILSILPQPERLLLEHYLRIAMLKKVPMLETMDKRILEALCSHLKPKRYDGNIQIIGEGEPLDRMLFITQGTAITFVDGENMDGGAFSKGAFYGEEVLKWASELTSDDEPILSTRTVKSVSEVEALVLMANDIKSVVRKYWWHFGVKNRDDPQLQELAGSNLVAAWRRRSRSKKPTPSRPLAALQGK